LLSPSHWGSRWCATSSRSMFHPPSTVTIFNRSLTLAGRQAIGHLWQIAELLRMLGGEPPRWRKQVEDGSSLMRNIFSWPL
jgi:hypothetical protein